MNYNSQKKEMANNLFFLLLVIVHIGFSLYSFYSDTISDTVRLSWIAFILFSGIIYGFVSKNPLKSFLAGTLSFPISLVMSDLILDYPNSEMLSEHLLSNLPSVGIILFYLILGGLIIFFMDLDSENEAKKRMHTIAISAFIILSTYLCFDFAIELGMGLIATLGGLSGYFMAQRSENRWRRLIYIVLSLLFLFVFSFIMLTIGR